MTAQDAASRGAARSGPSQSPAAAGRRVLHLRERRDYLRVQGSRQAIRGRFLLLAHADQPAGAGDPLANSSPPSLATRATSNDRARAGFTVSRKVGNAVVRNRVKRRLRALWAAQGRELTARDLVFVAFAAAKDAPFSLLAKEFSWLCRQMQARLGGRNRSPGC